MKKLNYIVLKFKIVFYYIPYYNNMYKFLIVIIFKYNCGFNCVYFIIVLILIQYF